MGIFALLFGGILEAITGIIQGGILDFLTALFAGFGT